MLDDIGIGQALFLLTGLPPFLRVKELRAKDRGERTGVSCPLAGCVWQPLGGLGVANWIVTISLLNLVSLQGCWNEQHLGGQWL